MIVSMIVSDTKICNKMLYENCNEEPVSRTIKANKWKLLEYILYQQDNPPAVRAMKYYLKTPSS